MLRSQNNPFNIRKSKHNHWKGKIISLGNFESFITIKYGIRAFILLIYTYRYKYGLVTIRDIIYRYAPPSENDTEKYMNFVARKMGCSPSDEVNVDNFYSFARAVAFYESNFVLDRNLFNDVLNML